MGQCEVQSRPSPFRNVTEGDKRLLRGVICESTSPVHQSNQAIVDGQSWIQKMYGNEKMRNNGEKVKCG